MNRREFLKLVGVGTLASVGGVLLGSKFLEEERKETTDVTVRELNKFPEKYVDKKIRVEGYPEYVGYESYFLPLPYYDPLMKVYSISLSQITTTTYKLHESPRIESEWVRMIKSDGPLYLPLPVVFAPKKVYENHLRVTGIWRRDEKDKDKYFLDVSSIEELK